MKKSGIELFNTQLVLSITNAMAEWVVIQLYQEVSNLPKSIFENQQE
jgi:hypothetical protein